MTSASLASRTRWILQFLFVLSGCAALIYQSIWTHYLGLTLGHAAYAQTLVLMMFMGGMALGAWGVSRVTAMLRRPIAVYAGAEALIGVFGLVFHTVFVAYSELSQDRVLPALSSAGAATAWQWLSAAALIAPQTVLLGATFPLLAVGVLRLPGSQQSQTLGGLYFTNGIGAALGALIATFGLLPAVGMPGALQTAAWLNLAVAAASMVLSLAWREGGVPTPPAASDNADGAGPGRLLPALLVATFLSSAASFAYELGWVRMLNQALGSSLHSFELMLAAFIAGLALGGLWVRRVGDRIGDLVRYAGFVQVAMGLCAIASVGLLGSAYNWVPWLLQALARSAAGYILYNVATAGIAVLIMVPVAFFAGMTLPLFTAALLRRGAGERAIGQVYAANTLGAILGVLVAAHWLMPAMGVGLMLLVAAAVDFAIGLALLRSLSPGRWTVANVAIASVGAVVLSSMLQWGLPDRLLQSAGVFRYGNTDTSGRELLYYRDGATASISVVRKGQFSVISTNGKPDAGWTAIDQPPSADEITMLMLGALALSAHPQPQDIAVIGWGSGLSTHTLLGSAAPRRVDSIEIEPAMWEGAKALGARNVRAYADPRSHVHFEDAREFFARGQQRYDVVASEPSNPWVSGVASLFTQEFYRRVKSSLKPDGLLVQWVHGYEISDALLAEMIAALISEFPDSELYFVDATDLLILAPRTKPGPLSDLPWRTKMLSAELKRVGLRSPADLEARHVGGPGVLRSYVRMQAAHPHSDFFPTISLNAPQQRFQGAQATLLLRLATAGLPVLPVLDCRAPLPASVPLGPAVNHPVLEARQHAVAALQRFDGRAPGPDHSGDGLTRLVDALQAQHKGATALDEDSLLIYLANLAQAVLGHIDGADQQALWDGAAWRRLRPELSPRTFQVLGLYESVSRQNWQSVETQARQLLAQPPGPMPQALNEQILVLGMLAGIAQGKMDAVRMWEAQWVARVPAAGLAETRQFLKAWEDGGERACSLGRPT
ncbi:fused MFS/spermidine synthase [Roseateles sp. P5_E1]